MNDKFDPLRPSRNSSFVLDALMVVEVNVSVDQIIRFLECLRLVPAEGYFAMLNTANEYRLKQ